MTWFLRLFSIFNELENLSSTQAASLEEEVRAHMVTKDELDSTGRALELERAKRISAEVMASERREEITRILDSNRFYREQNERIVSERLKSLDSINVKLMEPRNAETPDLAKYQQMESLREHVAGEVRQKSKALDSLVMTALLKKHHPNFQPRVVLNEPAQEPAA